MLDRNTHDLCFVMTFDSQKLDWIFLTIFLIAKDAYGCDCENGGTCVNQTICICSPFFSGTNCQHALFLQPTGSSESCTYNIQHLPLVNKQQAIEACEKSHGHLAMPSTLEKHESIESLFYEHFTNDSIFVDLFVGSIETSVFFDDKTQFALFPDENDFPPWGQFHPDLNAFPDKTNTLLISNSKQLHRIEEDNSNKLFWTEGSSIEGKGYICEKPKINPCWSSPCKYPARCSVVGCSYTCSCDSSISQQNLLACSDLTSCSKTTCANKGKCSETSDSSSCSCLPGTSGSDCRQELFFNDEMQEHHCEYLIRYQAYYTNFEGAKIECRARRAVLASIKNKHQQQSIENIIKSLYPNADVALWINGERNTNGDFVFSNKQLINSSSFDGYPNWALNKSSSNLSNDALLFTTYLNLDPATAEPNNSTKIFYWMDVNRNNLAGFICEKQSESFSVCSSNPCQNGGECVTEGCGFVCECPAEYTGETCSDCVSASPCNSSSCNQNGICSRASCTSNNFLCTCDVGWTGEFCNECADHACHEDYCLNGGVCKNPTICSENITCTCPDDYVGIHCETCVHDPCHNITCHNGGTCRVRGCSTDYYCDCLIFFTGEFCDSKVFIASDFGDDCRYFISNGIASDGGNYPTVSNLCEILNGRLAEIKSLTQQNYLYKLIEKVYGKNKHIYLWIGGRLQNQKWKFSDTNTIPLRNIEGYPLWGKFQPYLGEKDKYLMLTNSPKYAVATNTKQLFWASYYSFFNSGYICEKRVSNDMYCDKYPCFHGGTCLEIGCSFRCTCNPGYVGQRCEFILPRLESALPLVVPFQATFTLSCAVNGDPIPEIVWKIVKQSQLSLQEIEVEIQSEEGSPFIMNKEHKNTQVISTLTIKNIGLCLNATTISCWAVDHEKDATVMHNFSISRGNYLAINDSYYVFSTITTFSKYEAEEKCKEINGDLATILDSYTQEILSVAVNGQIANGVWKSVDAWIGLIKPNGGTFLWLQKINVSFTNWFENEPKPYSNEDVCVHFSNQSKWKTRLCNNSNDEAIHYICEIKDRGEPHILDATSPYGAGTRSSALVRLKPHPIMSSLAHHLSAKSTDTNISHSTFVNVIPTNISNDTLIDVSIPNLISSVEYEISVQVGYDYCFYPIEDQLSVITTASTQAKVSMVQNICNVSWVWPPGDEADLSKLTINVTKQPFTFTGDLEQKLTDKLAEENILQTFNYENESSNTNFVIFSAYPNRRHEISLIYNLKSGKNGVIVPEGECSNPPEAPLQLDTFVLKSSAFDKPSFSFSQADETNGSISCYFLIAIYHDDEPETKKFISINRVYMDLANSHKNEIYKGIPYIAVALPKSESFDVNSDFPLGDSKTTSCNVFDLGFDKTTKQKRSVDNSLVYLGRNSPLVENKFYSFILTSSTPVGDDDVVFASSKITTQYVGSSKTNVAATVLGSIVIIIALVLCIPKFFTRDIRKKIYRRPNQEILREIPIPDTRFSSLKEDLFEKSIGTRDFQKQGKISSKKGYEVWRIVLSTKLRYGQEALAKIVQGASMTDRQRQDFYNEAKIMNVIGTHESIISFYGMVFSVSECILVTEFCPKGTLLSYLENIEPFRSKRGKTSRIKQFAYMCFQVVRAIQYLHQKGIIHRALSCHKIYVTNFNKCKVGDFQYSREVKEGQQYKIEDLKFSRLEGRWMAPEAFYANTFSTASDVWTLGIVMWEIFSEGEIPYAELQDVKLEVKVLKENYRLKKPEICPESIYEIMKSCWNTLPYFRPSATNVKKKLRGFFEAEAQPGMVPVLYDDGAYENFDAHQDSFKDLYSTSDSPSIIEERSHREDITKPSSRPFESEIDEDLSARGSRL